jgi:hypothetical protein
MKTEEIYNLLPKKEVLELEKERSKLEKSLGGIKNMDHLPGAIFVVDPKGILRAKLYLPLTAERNFYEVLKLIDVLQTADSQKMLNSGRKTLRPDMAINTYRSGGRTDGVNCPSSVPRDLRSLLWHFMRAGLSKYNI